MMEPTRAEVRRELRVGLQAYLRDWAPFDFFTPEEEVLWGRLSRPERLSLMIEAITEIIEIEGHRNKK